MKKQFLLTSMIFLFSFFIFQSCKKDTVNIGASSLTEEVRGTGPVLSFIACNTVISSFNPSGSYHLAMNDGNSYRKFGIPVAGTLNFTNIDAVTFEFSGLYADKGQTRKLYYIRRSDGRYLTTMIFGALEYIAKQTDAETAKRQRWLIHSLGNNKYNVIDYELNACSWVHTYYENGQYHAASYMRDYGSTLTQNSVVLHILPTNSIPPNGN